MDTGQRKKALITGITGQDGSYLAEFLLKKEYEVHGIMRRSSTFPTVRIEHIYQDPHDAERFFLHYGDLSDSANLRKLVYTIEPDELYNLGAQSHVRTSFDIPEYTANVTGVGVLRVLEAIKDYQEHTGKKIKFYQASSSEMFGAAPPPQNEETPFQPRSPYGISKVFGFYATKNYREAYGIFACNGILFNHETITSFMPMFCKEKGERQFDVKPVREIVEFDESKKEYQSKTVSGIQVWGKNGWVEVTCASAYPHDILNDNKRPRFVNSRIGAYMATSSHVAFMDGGEEKETKDVRPGDKMEVIALPNLDTLVNSSVTEEEAELMGMMVGDGSITYKKDSMTVKAKFTNSSQEVSARFSYLWSKVTGGRTTYYPTRSGFNPEKIVGQLGLASGNDWLRKIDIYNKDRTKRIPQVILNSSPALMLAFLRGYNVCDGLRKSPCTYEFRNFKTNSATLAMGLWYLIDKTTGQDINLTLEQKKDGRLFYSLNILSSVDNEEKETRVRELIAIGAGQREMSRITEISRTFIRKIQNGGSANLIHHLRKNSAEVKKILDLPNYDGWFYDLETSSGEFHCGIGKIHVHNSPRRGETFVTRKVARGIARIKAGLDKALYLGNLDARRDWGHAKDYVEAMWLMLQQEKPDDYVIGTGQSRTVRELVDIAFRRAGIPDWEERDLVKIDPRYYRPTEVDHLRADYTKAKTQLGWEPKVKFVDLVHGMVDEELKKHGVEEV